DRLTASDLLMMFTDRACDPRWRQVLLAVLWRNKRPGEISELVQAVADQADGDRPTAVVARELLAEAGFRGYKLPPPETAPPPRRRDSAARTHHPRRHRGAPIPSAPAAAAVSLRCGPGKPGGHLPARAAQPLDTCARATASRPVSASWQGRQ